MSKTHLLCTGCKDFFPRDRMHKLPRGNYHSIECARKHGQAKADKARERKAAKQQKEWASDRRVYNGNETKTRKAAAKASCHAYIRERDRGSLCICCNQPLGEDFHAGHWIESGNNPKIRYHEDNIHGQKLDCNYFKGGDSGDYENNLTARIGTARVAYLKTQKLGTMTRTADDYREIESYYKEKLRELKNEI